MAYSQPKSSVNWNLGVCSRGGTSLLVPPLSLGLWCSPSSSISFRASFRTWWGKREPTPVAPICPPPSPTLRVARYTSGRARCWVLGAYRCGTSGGNGPCYPNRMSRGVRWHALSERALRPDAEHGIWVCQLHRRRCTSHFLRARFLTGSCAAFVASVLGSADPSGRRCHQRRARAEKFATNRTVKRQVQTPGRRVDLGQRIRGLRYMSTLNRIIYCAGTRVRPATRAAPVRVRGRIQRQHTWWEAFLWYARRAPACLHRWVRRVLMLTRAAAGPKHQRPLHLLLRYDLEYYAPLRRERLGGHG